MLFKTQVIPFDEQARLRALVTDWKGLPLGELKQRCKVLKEADERARLPTYVYRQWVQMSAMVIVSEIGMT